MVAECEAGLQKVMNSLHFTATKYGMKINIKKTKVLIVFREGDCVVAHPVVLTSPISRIREG